MNYKKLVNELEDIKDSATKLQRKRQERLKFFLDQFKAKEEYLCKKLKKENDKTNRRKLKNELGIVKKAYAILGSEGIKISA